MRLSRALLVVFLSLFGVCFQAAGASRPTSVDAEIEGHLKLVTLYFEQQKYAEAIGELQQAYALEPRPVFLFNIGQIHRKAGQPKDAMASYQRFLEVAPKHALSGEARGYIADMKVLIAEQERGEKTQSLLLAERERSQQQQQALLAEQQRAEQAQLMLLTERKEKKPIYKRAWFWGVMGGAVAVTALAVGLGVGLRPPPSPPTDTGYLDLHF